jgi:dolichol-phosphate mannosyltransferase
MHDCFLVEKADVSVQKETLAHVRAFKTANCGWMVDRFSLKVLAIVPVYKTIAAAIDVLKKFRDNCVTKIYLAVDDPRFEEEQELRKAIKRLATPVSVFLNSERKGVGCAIRDGIDYGIANHFDIAVVLAGNGKDNPREIPKLLSPILTEGVDYVQGSRFMPGGIRVNNPFLRQSFSRFYPFAWTLLTGRRCTDVTNGFRAFKLSMFSDSRINIHQKWLDDYQLEYYIHFKALTLGYITKEVPVSKIYPFRHRGGYSNISPFRDWWKIVSPLIYLKLGARN